MTYTPQIIFEDLFTKSLPKTGTIVKLFPRQYRKIFAFVRESVLHLSIVFGFL